MAKTRIRVGERLFRVTVKTSRNSQEYICTFHEMNEALGRTWGFNPSNKNFNTLERTKVYDWLKKMVEKNLPQGKAAEDVLEDAIDGLTQEYDEVEQE